MTLRPFGTPSARLYAEAFGGTEEEALSTFSALRSAGAIPLLLFLGDRLVSQGFGLPLEVGDSRILYLYALATDAAARNRGYLRTLLKETESLARDRGYRALCLLPADRALAAAYGRMGFSLASPAGATALPACAEEFSFYTEAPPPWLPTDDLAFLHARLGRGMSQELFAYTLSSLDDIAYPARLGDEAALLSRHYPGCALALTEGALSAYRRRPTAELLMRPLSTDVTPPTEPLPR